MKRKCDSYQSSTDCGKQVNPKVLKNPYLAYSRYKTGVVSSSLISYISPKDPLPPNLGFDATNHCYSDYVFVTWVNGLKQFLKCRKFKKMVESNLIWIDNVSQCLLQAFSTLEQHHYSVLVEQMVDLKQQPEHDFAATDGVEDFFNTVSHLLAGESSLIALDGALLLFGWLLVNSEDAIERNETALTR